MSLEDKYGRGGKRPGSGRPKGTIKPNKEQKPMRGIRMPQETWDKLDALKPEGVTLAKFMEGLVEDAVADKLHFSPTQAGVADDAKDRFILDYLDKFKIQRPFSSLSEILGGIVNLARTKNYRRVAGSPLTADDKTMENIAKYALEYTEYPIALVNRSGGLWLVWCGTQESPSPELDKFMNRGKVISMAKCLRGEDAS